VGLEEEAVFSLLQTVTSDHQIRSAFTRGSFRGWVYVEGVLDANTTFLLSSTPGIIRKRSGLVRHTIDPSDWVKLLTMKDPMTVVEARQWIRIRNGAYKGELGFLTHVEAWGVRVLVVPRLKTPTARAATSLKRKRTPVKPEPCLFDPATFSTTFQRELKLLYDGSYTSRGLVFRHGLLELKLGLHSISLNSANIPSRILGLFKLSSHPALVGSSFPPPEEWTFEEGERVFLVSSEKEATIAAVKYTHLEVDLSTNEGTEAVSWYNVRKIFFAGDFVSVASGPLRGTTGWVDRIADDTVYFFEYKEKGNVSTSSDDIKVSFFLISADIY
jgi:hypothetical protein